MVEIGFARFLRDSARVDELLSLLSMARWLDSQPGFTFETYLTKRMDETEVRWKAFEDALAFYVCRAFQPKVPLTEIFDFFGTPPDWANQSAELVTFTRDEHGICNWATINLSAQQPTTPGGPLGLDASGWKDVLKWLNNQHNIPICFPSNLMGPDLFFVLRLQDGRLIWIAKQAKCYKGEAGLGKDLNRAIRSVTPSNYYKTLKVILTPFNLKPCP
jgi:hypothetical protein